MAEHGRAWVRPDRHNVKLGNVLQEFDLVAAFPVLRFVCGMLRFCSTPAGHLYGAEVRLSRPGSPTNTQTKKEKKQNQPTNPPKKPPEGGFTVQSDRPKSSWQHQGMRHQLVTQCLQNCVDIIQARVAFLRKRTLQSLSGHANFFGNS